MLCQLLNAGQLPERYDDDYKQ